MKLMKLLMERDSKLWVKPKNKTIEEVKEQIREEDREATKES